jgi:hypothetical protein
LVLQAQILSRVISVDVGAVHSLSEVDAFSI